MSETKLRDVIVGAMDDAGFWSEDAEDVVAEVIDGIMRHLGKAPNIELDDGTLFVRRNPQTREDRDALLHTAAEMMAAYDQRHVAIALIEAIGHA